MSNVDRRCQKQTLTDLHRPGGDRRDPAWPTADTKWRRVRPRLPGPWLDGLTDRAWRRLTPGEYDRRRLTMAANRCAPRRLLLAIDNREMWQLLWYLYTCHQIIHVTITCTTHLLHNSPVRKRC